MIISSIQTSSSSNHVLKIEVNGIVYGINIHVKDGKVDYIVWYGENSQIAISESDWKQLRSEIEEVFNINLNK
jgi:hypothetical protein